jgi:hypothetical protein
VNIPIQPRDFNEDTVVDPRMTAARFWVADLTKIKVAPADGRRLGWPKPRGYRRGGRIKLVDTQIQYVDLTTADVTKPRSGKLYHGNLEWQSASREAQAQAQLPDYGSGFQAELALPHSLTPSRKLVDLWIDGIQRFAKSGTRLDVELGLERLSVSEKSEALSRQITSVITSFAHFKKYENFSPLHLADAGRWDVNFQIVLSEHLPLVPDRSDEFLSLLLSEIKSALRSGWTLSDGSWGSLNLVRNEVVLLLNRQDILEDPSFEAGIEL